MNLLSISATFSLKYVILEALFFYLMSFDCRTKMIFTEIKIG